MRTLRTLLLTTLGARVFAFAPVQAQDKPIRTVKDGVMDEIKLFVDKMPITANNWLELARSGGHFGSQESRTHHNDSRRFEQVRAKCEGIIERAQHVNAAQRRLPGQRARPQPGGNQQAIVCDALARIEQDVSPIRIEACSAYADAMFHAILGVEIDGPQHHIGNLRAAAQHVLRKRWTVVARVTFAVDEHELTRESVLA